MKYLLWTLSIFSITACKPAAEEDATSPQYIKEAYALIPLQQQKIAPQPGEWLYNNPDEMGQPLAQYFVSQPYRATDSSNVLYLVKIGDFNRSENEIFEVVKTYLGIYFQIKTDTIKAIALSSIPKNHQRINSTLLQLKTTYILDSILLPKKPKNAFALIGFSSKDLYPDEKWNFVFGQASLRNGVGVWSLARLGDLQTNEAANKLALLRSLKVASHETAHMFSMPHCVKYACNINGSNSLPESDKQPEWLCWECLAKLCFNRNILPRDHIANLLEFHEKMNIDQKAIDYYQNALAILDSKK